jgi:hypothetical protein
VIEMRKSGAIVGVVLVTLLTIGGETLLSARPPNQKGSIQINNQNEAQFAGMAKISMDSAINAALQAVPGKVIRTELENENGYLLYDVEIVKADRQIADVKIDAGNGKVLNIEKDKKDSDEHKRKESENDREMDSGDHEKEDSGNEHEEVSER